MPIPETTQVPNETPDQHSRILVRSSLSILGAFLHLVRSRFSTYTTDDFPYIWTDDEKTTKTVIELAYNEKVELRGMKPTILLGKGPTMWSSVVIGDRSAKSFKTSIDAKYMVGHTQVVVSVISRQLGEAYILADVISHLLIGSSDAIRDLFGLRDVFNIVEGTPTPYPQAKDHWQIPISFDVSFEERWIQQRDDPKISNISLWFPTGLDDPEWYRRVSLDAL